MDQIDKDIARKKAYDKYNKKRQVDPVLKEKHDSYHREWSKKKWRSDPVFRAERKKATSDRRRNTREVVIAAYGGKCACCGLAEYEFLSIDHIDGRGKRFGKTGRDSYTLYNWLVSNNFPTDDYRLLCMNCNFAFGKYGYCPHIIQDPRKKYIPNFGSLCLE